MKNVTSRDPRKKIILEKLKQESRGRKVTNVTEVAPGKFEGDCLKPEIVRDGRFTIRTGKWELIGRYFVQFELNLDGSLGSHINGGDTEDASRFTAIPKELNE